VAFETAIAFWTNNEQPWKASYSMLTSVTQVARELLCGSSADDRLRKLGNARKS
jgi:hypothetical protein